MRFFRLLLIEVAYVGDLIGTAWEEVGVEVDEVVVGHAGDIICHDELGGLIAIGSCTFIVHTLHKGDMVGEYGGGLVVAYKMVKQLFEGLLHHGTDDALQGLLHARVLIDEGVVFAFYFFKILKMRGVHGDAVFAVAVLDDVDHEVIYYFGVYDTGIGF